MRILHVAEAFGGGLMEMVRLVTARSATDGHAVAIVHGVRPETPADVRAVVAEEVELFRLDWRRRSPRTQVAAGRALRRLTEAWQPDVVHLHSSFAGVVGGCALRGRMPLIFTPHAFASALPGTGRPRRAALRAAERLAVRSADVVAAVSASEARVARELGARDVVVVPNGIPELDHEPRRAMARGGPARPRIIACGRIIAQRRPEACARILSRVDDVAEVAWIGGGGDQGPQGRAAIAALEAAGVPISGWVPRSRVLEELAGATAYLHWTSWDGQPLSVLEAMATGALVVASDIEPNRELLDSRQLAASEDEAVALLRRVVRDPAFATALLDAQDARSSGHSAREMCERWHSLYSSLILPRSVAAG